LTVILHYAILRANSPMLHPSMLGQITVRPDVQAAHPPVATNDPRMDAAQCGFFVPFYFYFSFFGRSLPAGQGSQQ
jgi:hypothetical protein